MNVIIKSAAQIEGIRRAARLAIATLKHLTPLVTPGTSTLTLDQAAHAFITDNGGIPAPLNYHGFPKSICTSINEVICHGIPSSKEKLKSGDIINVDITVILDGFFADTSMMFPVDAKHVSSTAKRLVADTQQALYLGIQQVAPGKHLGDIGWAIEQFAKEQHLSVVREYCGHGVGIAFHEDPYVMHYGKLGQGIELKPGMVFTIEPMLNLGSPQLKVLKNDWTAVTCDGKWSAQWEHTVLVTDSGYEILTWRQDESIPRIG